MNRRILLSLLLFLEVCSSKAGTISYVVLDWCSLYRISDDGMSRQTITDAACSYRQGIGRPGSQHADSGYDLTRDHGGDYIVASASSLLRVNPQGKVGIIARAPEGSGWIAVAVDGNGNLIVADNEKHAIWRVSGDGQSVAFVANYPVSRQEVWECVGIVVEPSGDYLIVGENTDSFLVRVTPRGVVNPIPLRGDKIARACRIIADGEGNYLVTSLGQNAVFRVTPAGQTTMFAMLEPALADPYMVLTRVPEHGGFALPSGRASSLLKIDAHGTVTKSAAGDLSFGQPRGMIIELAR